MRSLSRRTVTFGSIGLANLVLDAGLFNLLLVFWDKPLTSKFISSAVALVSSYYMNRHWTWGDRMRPAGSREPAMFVAMSLVGVGIAEVCLLTSHYLLGFDSRLADNVSANVIGLALAMVWRFWSYNRWVFTAPTAEPGAGAADNDPANGTTPRTIVLPSTPLAEPAK